MKLYRLFAVLVLCAACSPAQPPASGDAPRIVRAIKYTNFKGIRVAEIQKLFDDKKVLLEVESPFDQKEVDHAKAVLRDMLIERVSQTARVQVSIESVPPRSVSITFTAVLPD